MEKETPESEPVRLFASGLKRELPYSIPQPTTQRPPKTQQLKEAKRSEDTDDGQTRKVFENKN